MAEAEQGGAGHVEIAETRTILLHAQRASGNDRSLLIHRQKTVAPPHPRTGDHNLIFCHFTRTPMEAACRRHRPEFSTAPLRMTERGGGGASFPASMPARTVRKQTRTDRPPHSEGPATAHCPPDPRKHRPDGLCLTVPGLISTAFYPGRSEGPNDGRWWWS